MLPSPSCHRAHLQALCIRHRVWATWGRPWCLPAGLSCPSEPPATALSCRFLLILWLRRGSRLPLRLQLHHLRQRQACHHQQVRPRWAGLSWSRGLGAPAATRSWSRFPAWLRSLNRALRPLNHAGPSRRGVAACRGPHGGLCTGPWRSGCGRCLPAHPREGVSLGEPSSEVPLQGLGAVLGLALRRGRSSPSAVWAGASCPVQGLGCAMARGPGHAEGSLVGGRVGRGREGSVGVVNGALCWGGQCARGRGKGEQGLCVHACTQVPTCLKGRHGGACARRGAGTCSPPGQDLSAHFPGLWRTDRSGWRWRRTGS